MNLTRAFPAFSATWGFFYCLAFHYSSAAFTYYPLIGEFRWGNIPATEDTGPAMFWYGWILTATIGAAIVGILSLAVPNSVRAKIWPGFTWVLAVAAFIWVTYLGREWFL